MKPSPNGSPEVSVLITTRDRRAELEYTLERLSEQSYPGLEILVYDDASSQGCPEDLPQRHSDLRVIRGESQRGYIRARNRLMREARGEYLVHLDDDAHWVREDALAAAVGIMEDDPTIGAFAFSVHEDLSPPTDSPRPSRVTDVRSFTGCGHIIRRSAFEAHGPLKEAFEFYCEEIDFCLTLWAAGLRVVSDPGLIVHHRVDWALRDSITVGNEGDHSGHLAKDRRVRIGTRNELWWITERAPLLYLPALVLNKMIRLYRFHRKRGFHRSVTRGIGDWARLLPGLWRGRKPLTLRAFSRWLRLGT